MTDVIAVVLWIGVTFYALFAGADFGAGFWDLIAGGARRGERPRALIDSAIAPVWEANHVWLIFCLVVLWTGFPSAFSSIMSTLFVPLTIAAFGIVLRGCGFAFLRVSTRLGARRTFGATFAISSLVTPFFFGATAGGIASGRVPVGNARGGIVASWVNPTSMLGGVLAVITCAYLAAVFLVSDARRLGAADLERYFHVRAIAAGVAAGVVAMSGIAVLDSDSPHLFDGLTHEALPLVVLSALCGVGALVALVRDSTRVARLLAVGAVATVVGGWGVAQYPNLLGTHLPLDAAVAPESTLIAILVVAVVAVLVLAPSLVLLYVLDQRGHLEG